MWRGQEVANAESLVKLKTGELEEFKKLEKRIGDVERKLTEQQLSAIRTGLEKRPSAVDIYTPIGNGLGAEYSKQLLDVFRDSGWKVETKKQPDAYRDGGLHLTVPDSQAASSVSEALKDAGVSYKSMSGTEFLIGPTPGQ